MEAWVVERERVSEGATRKAASERRVPGHALKSVIEEVKG